MATQYTEEFKKDAVRYWKEHPELGIGKCAKNLGVSKSALKGGINMDHKENMDKKIDLTVDEIQAMMDKMEKRIFNSLTDMEWEGSIQNAPNVDKNFE